MTPPLRFLTRFGLRVLSLLMLLSSGLLAQAQTVRYVKPTATGTGSGNSWANASGDLQAMIAASNSGQQVWVAQGTYKPGPAGNTDRTSSFSMKNGVSILGGFAATGIPGSGERNPGSFPTVLSGDIGTAGDNTDNSYHVIKNQPGLTSSAVLDGFLITGGNANGNNANDDGGGGMLNNGSGTSNGCSPLIRNCLFVGNRATNGGGALYNAGYTNGTSKPILINCAFQSNTAGQGGAIHNDGSVAGTSNPELTNCSFQANSAASGGAMSSVAFQGISRPVLTNCVVWGNGGASTFSNQQGAFIVTSYSLFESSVTGYNAGTGNLTTAGSPFLSTTDMRLNGCAPALNAGDNAAYSTSNSPTTDLAGNARVFPGGGRIDMGAYEFQTTGSLPISAPIVHSAMVSVGFSQPFTATIGTSPYSYSLASGSLPPGLSLATTGVLSGTPTQRGSFTFTVQATDANGCFGVSAPYLLTVDPASPIRYVKAGATGSGNSWADASGNLQGQIDLDGAQQVWVAQGTYKPTATPATTGPESRTISFTMKNGVRIIGGFPDTGTPTLAERNPGRFPTILSGDIGTAGNTADNTYHVVSNAFIDNSAGLDGFIITGGNANGTSDQPTDGKGFGGGMYNSASSPTLIDCIFRNNSASFEGGGLFNFGGSNAMLNNCSFRNNSALYGAGMANNSSSPTAIYCSFQSNTASGSGGGVFTYYGSPRLINCLFQANSAIEGGGMYSSNPETTPTVINCLFQRNSAERGGGVYNAYTNVTLTNCTFQGNSAFGGGVYNFSCSATLTNCVLFGNGDAITFNSVSGSVGATYCLMEPTVTGYTGDNNLTTVISPFVSPTDARLNACSPAINAGDNAAYNAAYPPTISFTTDPAGNPRIFPNGGRIDMGAYEYQATPGQTPVVANPSVNTATTGVAFNQRFTTSGGSGTFSYSLISGSLPPGLSLSTTGVLSGMITQVGSFTVAVRATDANGCVGLSAPYVLTVQLDSPIRYVRAGATGSGSSWADASGNLQGQINLVGMGAQQVWVAAGTYTPGTNRTSSFSMKNGMTILGGFPANDSPTLADRNSGSFITTLSGDIGTIGNSGDNSNHVIKNSGINDTAVLDGFVIRDGNANGGGVENSGGGMYNEFGSSPTLANCSFVGNRAMNVGGGIYSFNGSPTLTNCSFINNGANVGGGAYNSGTNARLTNCSFVGNAAVQGGGGFNDGGSNTLTNCSFLNNSASSIAGALFGNSNTVLTNCVAFGNGLQGFNSRFADNTFSGNVTVTYSLLQAGTNYYTDGGNNLATGTLPFISSSDARLNNCNPAINAGLNSANTTTSDLANNVRVFGDRIDMGAYEVQATPGVITVSVPSMTTATAGVSFSQNFIASGGVTPYTYSVASGSPAPGLTLASNGTLSGTPTQAGSFSITVKVADPTGCSTLSDSYVLTLAPPAPIRYARAGGTGSGSSWADASGDLQSQINLAGAEQVWVAQGTYRPGPAGTTDRSISFSMKNGVRILGGFPPDGSPTLDQRNPASLTTTLSGDIGTAGNPDDNSYHVISNSFVNGTAVLDGFVIRDGNANGDEEQNKGGGMYNFYSSPVVTNCSYIGNMTTGFGGGIYSFFSSPNLTNCSFQRNSAERGGGMYSFYSSPGMTNCRFQENSAGVGGGVYNMNTGDYFLSADPSLINCSFLNNTASQGGGIYNLDSNPRLTNSVVFGNGGTTTFVNNRSNPFDASNQSSLTVQYSLLEVGVTNYINGGNNLTTSVSPFVSPTDARLNNCAPAINAGDNAAYTTANGPATDLVGNTRIFPANGRIDMGAYEYQSAPIVITITAPGVTATTMGAAFSQTFSASGGSGPYSYSLASGSLPAGLNLATTGVLSGTPTQSGSFILTVSAADAAGCSGVSAAYVLTVSDPAAATPIRYVRAGASGSGDSWADASGDLQSQINLVGAQQVWVATGTYKPGGNGNTDRTISFSMKNGVAIYGGFAGTETSLSQRPAINPVSGNPSGTTLSGDIGNPGDNTDNSYHVIYNLTGLTTTAVLDGFVITGGRADGSVPGRNAGGGIYNDGFGTGKSCSPLILNCLFQNNSATEFGGALFNDGSFAGRSHPVLTNCLFQNNSAPAGGAINNRGGFSDANPESGSSPVLTNCSFLNNSASAGGAILNDAQSSGRINAALTNCFFRGNTAVNAGGAIYNNGTSSGLSNPTLTNCSFQSNAAKTGGAIYNDAYGDGTSSPKLINCSFQNNTAAEYGGAMYSKAIVGNAVSIPTLTNCVVFGNGGGNTFARESSSPVVATYSLFENIVGDYSGSNNLTTTVSPFVSTTDTRLNACSPAINSGLNSANSTATDLAGNPRVYQNGRIDMGAYEYQRDGGIQLTSPSVNTAPVGVAFSQTFTASGGTSPYSYSVASGSLPAGLNLATTGVLSGTPTQSGSFTSTVLGQDANGCSAVSAPYVLTVTDAVSPSPTLTGLTASPGTVCVGSPVTFTATVGNVTGSYGYTLTNGLGSSLSGTASGTVFRQSVTASGTGTQTFTLTVSNNGQSASSVASLTVNPLPVASLTNNGPLSCAQTSVTLTASGGSSYTFTTSNGVLGTPGSANTAAVSSPGTYSVTVANASGCVSSTSTIVTVDQSVPTVSINPSSATLSCASPTVSLTAVGTGSVRWSTGETTPVISVNVAGPYSVTLTSANGCSVVASTSVSQDQTVPVASLVSSGTLSCSVTSVTLTASPNGQRYTFSNGATQIGTSNQAVVNASGTYSVTVLSANGCSSVASVSVSQDNTVPVASLVSSGTLSCGVTLVTLTASPGGVRYIFSDGATPLSTGNQAVVSQAGLYSVTVTAANGCLATASTTVQSNTTAVTVINPSVNTATVGTAFSQNFVASGGTSPYSYSLVSSSLPAGLSLSTTGVLSGTPTQSGSFTLTVTSTDATGCSGVSAPYVLTVTDAVSPNPTLSAFAASPGAVCVGSPVTFTAMVGNVTVGNVTGSYIYTLTNGLGTSLSGTASGTLFSQPVTASSTGSQSFTLTVVANGQSAASVTTLTVNPLPIARLTNNGPLSCAQPSVTLTASGAAGVPGSSYTFTSGNGVIGTPGAANTVTVSTPGTYSVTVASTSGCVSTTSTVVTTDQSVPTVSINPSSATLSCASPSVSLTAVGTGSVRWSTGETTPVISVNVAGPYSVTLTSANGCSAVASVSVSQDNTVPVASLVSSGSLTCSVTSVTLTASPDGQRYTFSSGATQINTSNQAVVNASGSYSVTVVSANGCSAVASVSVSQDNTVPVASLVSSGSLTCSVTSVTLTANPDGQRYQFSQGATQIGTSNQAVVSTSGTYSVTVVSANGCSAVASTIVVGDQRVPTVSITANPSLTIAQGQSAILTAAATGSAEPVSVRWSTGETSASITVSVAGTYSVSATAPTGCSATVSAVLSLTSGPVVTGPFAITAVTTLNCTPVLPNRYSISFTPRYSGLDGQPISFSVVNELLPTTEPGPYTIQLYSDNSRISLSARQGGTPNEATYSYDWLAACLVSTATNTPPRLVSPIPPQSTTVGVGYSYVIPRGTFTDDQTPGSLQLSATGLPPGIRLTGYTLSGVPATTVGSPFSVTLTATDPGNLSVSTSFGFTVMPAPLEPVQPSQPFAMTGVSMLTCTPIADRININFTPRYVGLTGQPVAFRVVNELAATNEPGPYSLTLYRDNPVITLKATQTGSVGEASFAYNWLAACASQGQDNTPPVVVSPIASQTGLVGQSFELNIGSTFIDQETPTSLRYSVGGLPAGLTLTGTRIAGMPQTAGVSTVTLTATDPGGLNASTNFTLTVTTPVSPTVVAPSGFALSGVQTLSCVVVSGGQRAVTFTPQYAGLDGTPVSFAVVNELSATTQAGPYSLNLYTDNPVITLSAQQGSTVSMYRYNWLAGCPSGARTAATEAGSGLQVIVLGNPIVDQQVEMVISGVDGQRVDITLVDLQGVMLQTHRLEQAAAVDRVRLPVSDLPGVFMLQVSTATERRVIKLLKP